jgi:hypothetical protein
MTSYRSSRVIDMAELDHAKESADNQTCIKCGHDARWLRNGTCGYFKVPVTELVAPCGCACIFPEPAAESTELRVVRDEHYRAGMLHAAEICRNEFSRSWEVSKNHDGSYMSGYEDACDHLSIAIEQASVISCARAAATAPAALEALLTEGAAEEIATAIVDKEFALSEERLSTLKREFIVSDEEYKEQKRYAGTPEHPYHCERCNTWTIVNNVCSNCGKDERARYGDFSGLPNNEIPSLRERLIASFGLELMAASGLYAIPAGEDLIVREEAANAVCYRCRNTIAYTSATLRQVEFDHRPSWQHADRGGSLFPCHAAAIRSLPTAQPAQAPQECDYHAFEPKLSMLDVPSGMCRKCGMAEEVHAQATKECLGCIASKAGVGRCRIHEPWVDTASQDDAEIQAIKKHLALPPAISNYEDALDEIRNLRIKVGVLLSRLEGQ